MTYFVNPEHQKRYEKLVREANVGERESTVRTVFYLLSSTPILYRNMEMFFNVKGNYMESYDEDAIGLSTGERIIVALAHNLFNGYVVDPKVVSPHYVLSWLDHSLRQVYFQALQLKLGVAS